MSCRVGPLILSFVRYLRRTSLRASRSARNYVKGEKCVYITAVTKKIPCFSFFPRSSATAHPAPHRSTHAASRPAHSATPAHDWPAQAKLLGAFLDFRSFAPFWSPCALWLLDTILAPRVSSLLPVPSWAPERPGHLLSSQLFSNLPSARCLPSHSTPS